MPIDFEEDLSEIEKQREQLIIGLRMIEGVDLEVFSKKNGLLDQDLTHCIDHLIMLGYLTKKDAKLQLTEQGLLFYDTVAEELIA